MDHLEAVADAQEYLAGYTEEKGRVLAAKVIKFNSHRIDWFERKYAEWLATGAEAVWGFRDAPLPDLPEMP